MFHSCRKLNKPSIKYQSYPKSRKVDAFEQQTCNVTDLASCIAVPFTKIFFPHNLIIS